MSFIFIKSYKLLGIFKVETIVEEGEVINLLKTETYKTYKIWFHNLIRWLKCWLKN